MSDGIDAERRGDEAGDKVEKSVLIVVLFYLLGHRCGQLTS